MVNAYYCFARRVNKFGNFAITYGDEVKSLITLPRLLCMGLFFGVWSDAFLNAATTRRRSLRSGALHPAGGAISSATAAP